MPTPSQVFNEEIVSTREEILRRVRDGAIPGVQQAIAEELVQVDPPDGELTPEQAQELKQRYNDRLQRLSTELRGTAGEQKQQAQEETTAAHEAAILAAVALLSIPSSDAPRPQDYAPEVVEGLRIRINVRRPVEDTTDEMIERTLQAVGDDIGDAIDEATGEKTVTETVRNIGAAIAHNNLSGALEEIGQADLVDEDSDFSLSSASQLYSNVKRIVSHEVATVADETSKNLKAMNPAIGFVEWNLSPQHPQPDICDVLATQDLYGAGPGVYPIAVVPSLPHPHCLCNTRAIVRSPSEWTTENEVPDEPEVDEARVRELMEEAREEGQRSITDAHVTSQTDTLRTIVSQVHEEPRGV